MMNREYKCFIMYHMKTCIFNHAVSNSSIRTAPKYFIGATYNHGPVLYAKSFVANIYMGAMVHLPAIAPFSL